MTRYERRVLAVDDDGGFDVEGRVVAVLDSPKAGRSQVTALVETETTPTTFAGNGDDSEGIELYAAGSDEPVQTIPEKSTFFCGEPKSDDTPCEREVNGPDDTCWQHSKE